MTIGKRRPLPLVLLGILLPAQAVLAQTTAAPTPATPPPPADKEDVLQLSPFVVDSTKDTGYAANNTLSGTRLKTNLGDIAAAIQVVTKEMLQDTGSTNARELLIYTTNTEVGGVGGNFSASGVDSTGVVNESANFRGTQTRIRGLAAADFTRDYFPTSIPFDSYNTDRVEINRGANAALFGLGSPAGIINNTTSGAKTNKSSGSAFFSVGSYGSHRENVDFNVAAGGELGVRVAAVSDHVEFQQDPAYSDDNRLFAALRYDPKFLQNRGALSGVTFRGNYEHGKADSNMPRLSPPVDNISRWFAIGKPIWNPTVQSLATADRSVYSHNGNFSLVTMWSDPNSTSPGGLGTISIVQPARPNGLFATFATTTRTVPAGGVIAARTGGSFDPFIAETQLTDTNVFDYRNHMIDGPNKYENSQFTVYNAVAEARFFRNRLGFELAYNHEERQTGAFDPLRAQQDNNLSVDINTTMLNGDPNPNYGRPYLTAKTIVFYTNSEREAKRATGYYNFDFADVTKSKWAGWLGKHTLTALYSEHEQKVFNRSGFGYIVNRDLANYGQTGAADSTSLGDGASPLFIYLGPSILGANSISDVRLSPVTVEMRPDLLPSTQNYVIWNSNTNAWEKRNFGIIRQDPENMPYAGDGGRLKDNINSKTFVLQSSMLHDNLVSTLSWRADDEKTYAAVRSAKGNRNEYLYDELHMPIPSTPTIHVEGEAFSWGLVGKVPRSWLSRWENAPNFSVFYNDSQNFQAQGIRRNVYGGILTPPTGTSVDYGFMISTRDEKYSLRTTWYETSQNNVSSSAAVINQIANVEAQLLNGVRLGVTAADMQATSPGITQAQMDAEYAILKANPFPLAKEWNFTPMDAGVAIIYGLPTGTTDTYDLVSKGVEFEFVANPTPNWRIAMNASNQESKQDNTATDTFELLSERIAIWNQIGDLRTTSLTTNARMSAVSVLSSYYAAAGRDGFSLNEIRAWRFNALTNYTFSTGKLKGFGIGGAYRWEDKAAIGYKTAYDATLKIWRQDINSPYYDSPLSHVDAWISYQRPIFSNRIGWSVQLNVRNLLGEDDLVPIYANPDGTNVAFRVPEARRYEISTRFDF